jgi:prephenate dehydrogenase
MFKRLAIFGVGLIGGSFALALRRAGAVETFVGFGPRRETLEQALELGLVDEIAVSAAGATEGSDLLFVSAPVAQTGPILESIVPHLSPGAIVTDAGSTKSGVVAAARAALGDKVAQFIPGHPIAGREVHGPKAALTTLFDGKCVVLTPVAENAAADVATVTRAWEACGATVKTLPAPQHDDVFATVSHLPHLLSYALVAQILGAKDADIKFGFAGAGFRDFTRIAASNPEMWRDIMFANRDALLGELEGYQQMLAHLRVLIENHDGEALERLFWRASEQRLRLYPPA